eukprot:GHVU01167952.1.p1 GENE.GHVU01167952.1~~GHVU01167952.1.p1  ORF type:complete len:299 (+),score=38.76 GHVU01167952.1:477-1373(+)
MRRKERFEAALRKPGLSVIAEIKRKSPSAGEIAAIADPKALARAYMQGGASCISCLTDETFFGGSLEDLKEISRSASIPILRKDFIVDPIQIAEGALAGASAVLLMVSVLGERTGEFVTFCDKVGMGALVEVHDPEEMEVALATTAPVIGVNARNLKTFEVDLATVERLLPSVPEERIPVAESGLRNQDDIRRVGGAGAKAVLIGEALVRAPNVSEFIQSVADAHNSQARGVSTGTTIREGGSKRKRSHGQDEVEETPAPPLIKRQKKTAPKSKAAPSAAPPNTQKRTTARASRRPAR